jgi:hypothetical protein
MRVVLFRLGRPEYYTHSFIFVAIYSGNVKSTFQISSAQDLESQIP